MTHGTSILSADGSAAIGGGSSERAAAELRNMASLDGRWRSRWLAR